MEYHLTIGGIGFRIISDFEIMIEDSFAPFFYPIFSQHNISIEFSQDFRLAPRPAGAKRGEDLLLEFYPGEHGPLCLAKGGWKGPLAITQCAPDFSHLVCYMNTTDYDRLDYLGSLLRLVPIRRVLQHHGVLFLHAAQIALGTTGILFSAPSGTGKTTQARLWRDARDARIICNDRTLIRDGRTYGFPIDGSEPVGSGEVNDLGALVLLEQSKVNSVQRLGGANALVRLMPQVVMDTWDPESRFLAAEQLTALIQSAPVYLLRCTPDTDAVACLEQRLTADGVIK